MHNEQEKTVREKEGQRISIPNVLSYISTDSWDLFCRWQSGSIQPRMSGRAGTGGQRVICCWMAHTSLHRGVGLQQAMPVLQAWGLSHLPWSVPSLLELALSGVAGATSASPPSSTKENFHIATGPFECIAKFHFAFPLPDFPALTYHTHRTFWQKVYKILHGVITYIILITSPCPGCLIPAQSAVSYPTNLGLLRLKERAAQTSWVARCGSVVELISHFSLQYLSFSAGRVIPHVHLIKSLSTLSNSPPPPIKSVRQSCWVRGVSCRTSQVFIRTLFLFHLSGPVRSGWGGLCSILNILSSHTIDIGT